jgi:hypothetical protein
MVLRPDGRGGLSVSPREFSALLEMKLAELSKAADRFDGRTIRRKLREIVPEYTPEPPTI